LPNGYEESNTKVPRAASLMSTEQLACSGTHPHFTTTKCQTNRNTNVRQYWVVSANWGGINMLEAFIDYGHWQMAADDKKKPENVSMRANMYPGDGIAIRSMLEQGSPNICIRAIGVIEKVEGDAGRVYVTWVRKGLNRIVPNRGCYGAIHGPWLANEDFKWVVRVFLT